MYAKDSSIVTDDIIETFIPPPPLPDRVQSQHVIIITKKHVTLRYPFVVVVRLGTGLLSGELLHLS